MKILFGILSIIIAVWSVMILHELVVAVFMIPFAILLFVDFYFNGDAGMEG